MYIGVMRDWSLTANANTLLKENYMKVRELIENLDNLKSNSVDDGLKYRWIGEVEGRVRCEIHGEDAEKLIIRISEEDELLIPDAYAGAYTFYLLAMLEYAEGNTSAYESMKKDYETALKSYAKYFIRNR